MEALVDCTVKMSSSCSIAPTRIPLKCRIYVRSDVWLCSFGGREYLIQHLELERRKVNRLQKKMKRIQRAKKWEASVRCVVATTFLPTGLHTIGVTGTTCGTTSALLSSHASTHEGLVP